VRASDDADRRSDDGKAPPVLGDVLEPYRDSSPRFGSRYMVREVGLIIAHPGKKCEVDTIDLFEPDAVQVPELRFVLYSNELFAEFRNKKSRENPRHTVSVSIFMRAGSDFLSE
jgi:hypothetical protein